MKEFLKRKGIHLLSPPYGGYVSGSFGSIFIMFSTIFDNPPILFHSYVDVTIGIIILLFPHRHFFWNKIFSSERN